ncbi:alkylated DNA repair protein alkB like 8 [Apostasia shenzhenica]|uniref:Alkylated DNA repair protein alkB like 8 n=1 Tax=Apostasia shenzhenica TaxID=1088818 RepID=A0A2I0AXG3_9ASPA|nr:alkylated DNA repair protein alkB like 8 [Apostasia shenzhenica]
MAFLIFSQPALIPHRLQVRLDRSGLGTESDPEKARRSALQERKSAIRKSPEEVRCHQSRNGRETLQIFLLLDASLWIPQLLARSTFRTIVRAGCWSSVSCTSIMEVSNPLMQNTASINTGCSTNVCATPDIEKNYVHRVYNAIAPHFSSTRFAKWPKVAGFLNSLHPGSVVLDAGCGNGKYLGFNSSCFFIGCDISPPLIDICGRKGHEVLVADAVNLPYRTNFGDAAISIAVLHHLSTEGRRKKAIEELVRVVRRGGLVLVTVWAVEQEDSSLLSKWTPLSEKYNEGWVTPSSPRVRSSANVKLEKIPEANEDFRAILDTSTEICNHLNGFDEIERDDTMATSVSNAVQEEFLSCIDRKFDSHQEYFVPWHLPYHRAEVSGAFASAVANGLAKIDDKKKAVVYSRYYHVFVEGELQRLAAGIDNAEIVHQFFDKSNWCIILKKI